MAQKIFKIQQKANTNGVIRSVSATVTCEESEIDSFLALLEGQYVVFVEYKSAGSDAVVSAYDLLTRATYKAEGKANMNGAIFASGSGLVIKNTASVDEISNVIANFHPFSDDSTKKPARTSIKLQINQGAKAQ